MRRFDFETVWDLSKLVFLVGIVVLAVVVAFNRAGEAKKCEQRGGIYVQSYSGLHYYCAAGRK